MSILGLFSKKKKAPTVSEKLEVTMNKTNSPEGHAHQSFFTMEEHEQTMSDLDVAETMSANLSQSSKDRKFMNMMELLNNPDKPADVMQTLNDFFSSNLTTLSQMMQARKVHKSISKMITAQSFTEYNSKIGKINSMIQKNQEQDRKDREQYENAFQRKNKKVQDSIDRKYFDREHFVVSVDRFSRAGFEKLYEEMENKADMVEDALMFGIKARFYRYLDAMSDFNQVEEKVASQIDSIRNLRTIHGEMKLYANIIQHGIVKKKRTFDRKKDVLDKLSMFESISTNITAIYKLIENQEHEEAVSVYKKQEEMLYNKLKGYCLTEKFETRLNSVRGSMIDQCRSYVVKSLQEYLTECFQFSKKKPEGVADTSRLLHEMTIIANSSINMSMDVSVVERYESNSVPLYLLNSFEPVKKEEMDQLGKVISSYLSIKDFNLNDISEQVTHSIDEHVVELTEYLQEILNSNAKQVNIVSALIIANTIFERFISRLTHCFMELVDKVLKKFYSSMKSKFLRDRMSVSSLSVFGLLLAIKSKSIETFKRIQLTVFGNENNLKRVDLKDFQHYEEILDVFESNIKVLFDNNIVVVNEQKIDKSLADRYVSYLNSMQAYEYRSEYNRLKFIQNYFKAVSNKVSQDINQAFSEEHWRLAEVDYPVAETLSFILNSKFMKGRQENILNITDVNGLAHGNPEDGNQGYEEEDETPVLIVKNEILVNNLKFQISKCYQKILDAIKDLLTLGSNFVEDEPEVCVIMMKRVVDVVVVG